jgi:hypothetical protein
MSSRSRPFGSSAPRDATRYLVGYVIAADCRPKTGPMFDAIHAHYAIVSCELVFGPRTTFSDPVNMDLDEHTFTSAKDISPRQVHSVTIVVVGKLYDLNFD